MGCEYRVTLTAEISFPHNRTSTHTLSEDVFIKNAILTGQKKKKKKEEEEEEDKEEEEDEKNNNMSKCSVETPFSRNK